MSNVSDAQQSFDSHSEHSDDELPTQQDLKVQAAKQILKQMIESEDFLQQVLNLQNTQHRQNAS